MKDISQQSCRRIIVVGTSGSGKTYAAKAIAAHMGIKYICNDSLIWQANWINVPDDQRLPGFEKATDCDAWVIDGNVASTKRPENALLLKRADTIVWLDLPRRTVWPQLLWRTIKRSITREELWHGNRESFRLSFFSRDSILIWSFKTFTINRKRYQAMFNDEQWQHLQRIRITSRRSFKQWLSTLPAKVQTQS
ncbi:MAG TPA: hypothetical protein DER01_02200 [Phycisphaerales bacterium]|nr:hypothetical protein [Phycisphaerales bacterium]